MGGACPVHGTVGGTGFFVRTELLEQGLFLDFGSFSTVGFYGLEVIIVYTKCDDCK